jgi:hypothetical protein
MLHCHSVKLEPNQKVTIDQVPYCSNWQTVTGFAKTCPSFLMNQHLFGSILELIFTFIAQCERYEKAKSFFTISLSFPYK